MDNSHMVSLFVLRANTCNHVRTAGERGATHTLGPILEWTAPPGRSLTASLFLTEQLHLVK